MDLSFYTNFTSSLTAQETQLNTLEEEVSTGLAVQTPEQDPSAYETATIGTDQLGALTNESTSLADIQGQLGNVSDVYSSVSTLLDNVQSVVEEALNGTTSSQNMQSLATEVSASEQQLLGLANSGGTDGTYLFGGTRGNVQPFQEQPDGSVLYMGDGGTSQASISSDLTAATIANGETFMSGLEGDGYASVTAGPNTAGTPSTSNTGTGALLSEGVANPTEAAAFQASGSAGAITLTFTGSGSGQTYTATQTSGGTTTTLASGAVTSGMTLTLGGVDYQLTGTPDNGDSFTIAPNAPNTGTGVLLSDGVITPADAAAFQESGSNGAITLSFSKNGSGALTYNVNPPSAASSSKLASGKVTSSMTLTLDGMDFQLTGTPSSGDSFTIAPSQPQSVFSLLSNITSALENSGSSPAAKALTSQSLNQALSGLAQYQQTVVTAQAQTGVTLQSLTNTSSNNSTQETALETGVANATAANIPAAMTSLDENMTAVEAAMKAFSEVQSLSLFSYI